MEPIKIVDKLTLRQEALRMAVIGVDNNVNADFIAVRAKTFESYLQGSADLPEYVDPNADKQQWVDMLNKMREEMNPNPWISVNSDIKPAEDTTVLLRVKDDDRPFFGKWDGVRWELHIEDVVEYSDDVTGGFEALAWMPIPPFAEPLKL